MTFAILATAAAALMLSLALVAARPQLRRVPVRIRDRDPRHPPR
jgi:hypothetical protein